MEKLDARHTAMVLAVVFIATFMDGLDGSIVNVALPTIGESFGVDTATISWVAIVYFMVLAGTLVAFARIATDTGVRHIMAGGLGIFTVGSLVCGLSPSLEILIAARAVQGLGAAMMAAAGPICCVEYLPPSKLGFGMSIVTVGASVGFAAGPAVGGALVEFLPWHSIFLINVPIGIVTVPLMLKAISKSQPKKTSLDVRGTLVLFASIAFGTLALEMSAYPERSTLTIVSAILFIILLIAFVMNERRVQNPLIKLSMFTRWDFSAIFVTLLLTNLVYMAVLYLIPFYGTIPLGMSSLEIGAVVLVSSTVTAILGLPVARLSDRIGRKLFCVLSGLFEFVGFGILAAFAEDMPLWLMLVVMVLMGLGWAFVGGPMASRLVEHAGEERDMASSLMNEAYYVGGTIGTALIAMLFTVFSKSGGVDISDVTTDVFIEGFVPCLALTAIIGLVISEISAVVKDEKRTDDN
ncbi:MAG: MFS transporter [Candidatus Methanomethylophilaceae archaeon]|nr:MFS transporter [Candidatus Methanomethylophilaceae archaeon]